MNVDRHREFRPTTFAFEELDLDGVKVNQCVNLRAKYPGQIVIVRTHRHTSRTNYSIWTIRRSVMNSCNTLRHVYRCTESSIGRELYSLFYNYLHSYFTPDTVGARHRNRCEQSINRSWVLLLFVHNDSHKS